MEIFHALGPQVGMAVGLLSFAAEIILGYWLLRHFKIIRRREYDRLKGTEAEHQRCVAEWGRLCTAADQELGNHVEAEFDAREPVMSRR
jgi:hypothetical protein